ncbi:hypothetical protein M0R04_13965 [Candidatus Dojkabacteria bacterium]|jgi:hypothetical protein|nr:hypothetical protein [Candidatus Dojkabacteria bacterium]
MTKDLKEKAIDFKGKKYVLVSDRVIYFNDTYPEGSILTELVSKPEDDTVIVKATIKPDISNSRAFTGYSQATWGEGFVNTTSALENAETSAVGRALAFMGIGVIDGIASIDEIKKTTYPAKQVEEKLSPEIAKANARQAIEGANNLDVLMEVMKKIQKSKNLTEKDKIDLNYVANERRESFDPTA